MLPKPTTDAMAPPAPFSAVSPSRQFEGREGRVCVFGCLAGPDQALRQRGCLDNVSLTIEHGQLVCLLGPSGCGKTTTLRLIAGFVEPSEGEIRVGGRSLSTRAHACRPSGATCR